MNIFNALSPGFYRSVKAWKGILLTWFIYMILAALIAFPLKAALGSVMGNSMIMEKFSTGLNIEMLNDMGGSFSAIFSSLMKGIFIMLLFNLILNPFLSGGLFGMLRGRFSAIEFWKSASSNFWSFLIINLVISIIILFLFILVVILPVSVMTTGENMNDSTIVKTAIILFILFCAILAILLSISDYARAWQSGETRNRCFAAIGFGFSRTFGNFFSSWILMILLLIIQGDFLFVSAWILSTLTPATGGGIFLFFIVSQLLLLLRMFLKTIRYGSFMVMSEQRNGIHGGENYQTLVNNL